jgi:hypothetical protein
MDQVQVKIAQRKRLARLRERYQSVCGKHHPQVKDYLKREIEQLAARLGDT